MKQTHHQTSFDLIVRETSQGIVQQRASDGYINATELCKAAKKAWADYYRLSSTTEFLLELQADMGIPISALIQSVRGGNAPQGTWVHPQIAINLAQWLSAKFAVQVSKWVYDWMSGEGQQQKTASLPSHLARYIANDPKVRPGYFSVLQETGLNLFGPLHNVGFIIPKDWVPDISVGRSFCRWLREEKGVDTDSLPTYRHEYIDDGRVVDAKLYPDKFLASFRSWFRDIWLPINGVNYFKRKDPNSLPYLDRHPALAIPSSKTASKVKRLT